MLLFEFFRRRPTETTLPPDSTVRPTPSPPRTGPRPSLAKAMANGTVRLGKWLAAPIRWLLSLFSR